MDFLFFTGTRCGSFFGQTEGGPGRGTEGEGQDTRFGCPPVGFRRKRLLCWSFLVFSDGIFSERKSGRKERAAKELLDRLSLVFFFWSCSFLEREQEKGTERWMERIGVWNHSGRLFSSKDRFFFETPDPLFGWSSGSFTLNKLECSKQAKQHALNTLAWDNGIRPWSCFVGFLGTEVMINRDSRGH